MRVLQQLESALPIDDDPEGVDACECHDCGREFRTQTDPGRAVCEECRSVEGEEVE